MRFVHIADVHLDTPFAGRSETLRKRLREATRESFRRAVDLALDEEAHALLVAGDLFDGQRLSFATERFLLEELARLDEGGIRVIYATGNHDPGDASGRVRALEWPGNVVLVDDPEPRRVPVQGRSGEPVGFVTAAGHATDREDRDLASRFPRPPGPLPEVALLHAQVLESRGSGRHDRYAPTTLETLREAGYDYWALGHVHERQALSEEPPVHYPGNPQGRTPRERGARGALVVDVEAGGRARVRFRPLDSVRWAHLRVRGLEEARGLDGIEAAIREAWSRHREEAGAAPGMEWAVRLSLQGPAPLWRELRDEENRDSLRREMEGSLGVLFLELRTRGVHPVVEPSEHRDRPDVVGEALRLLEAVASGEGSPDPLGDVELAGPPRGGGDEERASYVRRLLSGAEGELLARLLPDPPEGG